MPADLPCITVREAIDGLSKLNPDAKLHAWLPGSYLPIAGVMTFVDASGRAMMETNIPADSAIGRALE